MNSTELKSFLGMLSSDAVLSHEMPDKTERPIAYSSRTMTPVERKYSQIEKKELSLVYGIKHFNQYLLGRHFTTDHKSLLGLLVEEKRFHSYQSRIERWALILSAPHYTLAYRQGHNHENAGCRSMLPCDSTTKSTKYENSFMMMSLDH